MKSGPRRPFHALEVLLFCLVVIVGIGVAGYLYTAAERRSFDAEARNQLAAIADMQVRQLSAWRAERLDDAKALQSNPFAIPGLLESLDSGRNLGNVETWMAQLLEAYHYNAASLWDRNSRRRSWLPAGDRGGEPDRELAAQVMSARTPRLVDLHRDETTGAAHMTLAVPLLSTASPEPIGALLLSIDPTSFLFPLIQTWPTPSRSAETLLIRREGDEVVYLNDLRHRKNTVLSLRFPLDRAGLPAARAALGYEGVLYGTDYRGASVLAATKHVPDSPWYLVAKLDTEEALAALRQRTRFIATSFGLLAAALIAGTMFLWSRQAAQAHKQQLEAELERRAILGHFDFLSRFANDVILLFDKTGRIIDANQRAVDSYGYDREELLQLDPAALHDPVDAGKLAEIWESVKAKGPLGLVFEAEHLRKDGSRFPVEVSARVIEVEGREFRQEIIRDITERKRVEKSLVEKEQQYHTLADSGLALIWTSKADKKCDYFNQPWLTFTGRSLEQELGDGWVEGVHPEDLERCIEIYTRAFDRREPFSMHYRLRRHDGEFRWILDDGAPRYDSHGSFLGYIGHCLDIGEQKRVEQALLESEDKFRSVVEQSSDLISLTDADGVILYVSPASEKLFGAKPKEMTGHHFTEFLEESSIPTAMTLFKESAEISWRTTGLELLMKRKDGSVFTGELNGSRSQVLPGAATMVVIRDITKRKLIEQQIQQLNAELEQRVRDRTVQLEVANRELESFSYSVSHDLRGPLRGIDGWSLALVEEYRDKLDAQACEYLDYIRSDAQRMGQLIDDMLRLAQVSRGRMALTSVDMGALSQAVAARLQERQPSRRVEFKVEPGLTASGDAGLLEIALTNLIDNAWKFSGKRPVARIEFGRTEVDGHPAFFIRDNGVGFDMAYVHKLFGPFQRLHKSSEFPGTGIGLAIVQRVVHRHNGRVWAEAQPDGGATFYFTLQESV